ncbi:MAG TPA: cell division protein FtsB [Solimonas sp.]|nr:cell division protein FtsB [Solimonas sp.]
MASRAAVVVLALLLLALQYRLWIADGGVAHTHRLRTEAEAQRVENARLAARNAALDAEVRDLNTGVAAIEGRARTTLGMIQQNETFYLVVQP